MTSNHSHGIVAVWWCGGGFAQGMLVEGRDGLSEYLLPLAAEFNADFSKITAMHVAVLWVCGCGGVAVPGDRS